MIRFGVLGPLRADRDGTPLPGLNASMLRRLLAALLCRANQPVPANELIFALWGEDIPPSARKTLQVYVRRLRAALEDDRRIVHEPAGYRIEIAADELDSAEFAKLVADGRAASAEDAAGLLGRAMALWRGVAFEDVREHSPIVEEARRLDEERLRVESEFAKLQLDLGRHDELIPHLMKLTAAHPYSEDLRGHLMLALYRAGRQTEALEIFRGTRKLLDEELGITPGLALQRLHEAILRTDPELDPAIAKLPHWTPRLLPADVNGFVGRQAEFRSLDDLASSNSNAVCVLSGTAGVGKTALAVRWAHRVAGKFPDGQLYVDLNGFAESPPVEPLWVLSLFLGALGVPPAEVPADEAKAAAFFRSAVATRRMLVVLDNARSVEQVRLLLPGASECFVLVTSRNRLGGLVAREGAHRIGLDVLGAAEAEYLLVAALESREEPADSDATAELARSCAYLPLALRIAAANLRDHPHWSVGDYVRRLDRNDRLDMLSIEGDVQSAVRAAFDLSYRDFSDDVRATFRLLGLIPGPTFSVAAVAAMSGVSDVLAESRLGRLASAHLVQIVGPDRFGLHDLLRIYAAEQGRLEDNDDDRRLAWEKLCDWYVASVEAAAEVLYRDVLRIPKDARTDGMPVPPMEPAFAAEWLNAENKNLNLALRRAAAEGPYPVVWLLADGLRGFWEGHTSLGEWIGMVELAMAVARRSGDPHAEAAMHLGMAHASRMRGDFVRAADHLRFAMNNAGGWTAMQIVCTGNLAGISYEMGHLDEAELLVKRSLENAQIMGRLGSIANATGNLGLVVASAGRLSEAVPLLRRGYELHSLYRTGNQSEALCNLGTVLTKLGEVDEASLILKHELALRTAEHDRRGEARFCVALTNAVREQGRFELALDLAARAIDLAHDLGDTRTLATAFNAAGDVYVNLREFARALDAFGRAFELAHTIGLYEAELMSQCGQADAHRGLGELALALDKADRAREAAQKSGHRFLEGKILTSIGQIYIDLGDAARASSHLSWALDLHRQTGHLPGLDRTHGLLSGLN